jgi:ribosomal protein L40E
MTIKQLQLGQCSVVSLGFSMQKDERITGTFGSDALVDFYIISKYDFDAFDPQDCRLQAKAMPLFVEENISGYNNPYRSLPMPVDGTYYFVFIYRNLNPIRLGSGYATVYLSFPSSLTLIMPEASTVTQTAYTPTFSSVTTNITVRQIPQATAISLQTGNVPILIIAAIAAIAIGAIFIHGKRGKGQKLEQLIKTESAKSVCIKCGKEVLPESKFCINCGSQLGTKFCMKCGGEFAAGMKFCPSCGTPTHKI